MLKAICFFCFQFAFLFINRITANYLLIQTQFYIIVLYYIIVSYYQLINSLFCYPATISKHDFHFKLSDSRFKPLFILGLQFIDLTTKHAKIDYCAFLGLSLCVLCLVLCSVASLQTYISRFKPRFVSTL